ANISVRLSVPGNSPEPSTRHGDGTGTHDRGSQPLVAQCPTRAVERRVPHRPRAQEEVYHEVAGSLHEPWHETRGRYRAHRRRRGNEVFEPSPRRTCAGQ